jgi:hypothetical protein
LPTDGGDVAALGDIHRMLRRGLTLLRTNSRLGLPGGGAQVDPDFQRYDLGQLADKARGAGSVVKRASYVNALPSLHASLKERVQRQRSSGRGHHHGTAYEGLGGVVAVGVAQGQPEHPLAEQLQDQMLDLPRRHHSDTHVAKRSVSPSRRSIALSKTAPPSELAWAMSKSATSGLDF